MILYNISFFTKNKQTYKPWLIMVCLWYMVAKIITYKQVTTKSELSVKSWWRFSNTGTSLGLHIFTEACAEVLWAFYISPGYGAWQVFITFCKSLALQTCRQDWAPLGQSSSRGGWYFDNLGYVDFLLESWKIEPLTFCLANGRKVQ